MTHSESSAPYETLARSIERELELVGEGRFDEVATLQAERAALISTLPDVPPAGARPALQRAALMSKRVEIEFLRYREALLLELANARRVGRAARGYAPPRERRSNVQATA
ncbi:MAG: hypothetical protein ACLP4R_10750 [Solirubrobacteraceae bacterium]